MKIYKVSIIRDIDRRNSGLWQKAIKVGYFSPCYRFIHLPDDFDINYSPIQLPIIKTEQILPISRKEWPEWVNTLYLLKTEEDKGIGDVIARTVGPVGGDLFKKWYKKIFNADCGCGERQDVLNIKYPFISQ